MLNVLALEAQTKGNYYGEVSIENVLETTKLNSPMIKKAAYDLEKSKTAYDQAASMKILPQVSFDFRTGLVPEARGNAVYSKDNQTDLDGLGPFFQTEFKIVQPIYTFGRLDNAGDAALMLSQVQVEKNRNAIESISLTAVQSYWALLASEKAVSMAKELKAAFDTLLVKIQTEINKEDSELDQSYLFEAKSNSYIIESLYNSSFTNKILAQKAFIEVTSIETDTNTVFTDKQSPEFVNDDNDLENALNKSELNNPDLAAVRAGLKAIEAKIKYEQSQKAPLIYFAGGLGLGYAGNRDDQKNPFVYDNFNYINVGAFIGLNWNLNFSQANIESKKWELEKLSLIESQTLLKSKIKIDINKSFYEAKNKYQALIEVRKSLQSAQSWVAVSYDNWEQGLGEPERLIKAMNIYFQTQGKALEIEFEYNLSLAKLAFTIGSLDYYKEWIKNEKITFN